MSAGAPPDPQELHAQVQHRLVEELASTERKLRGLLRSIPEVVVQLDDLGRIEFLNRAWTDLLGREVTDAIGHSLFEFVVPEDRGALPEPPAPGEPEARSTVRFQAADRQVRWFLVRLRSTEEGEVTGLLEDVTDRTLLEQQLRQSQKLEAVGQLASGVAHDFNNLLTIILGCGERLLNEPPEDPGEAREDLGSLLDAARRAADLTGQLLTFGRQRPLRLMPVRLGQVLEDMRSMLARLIGPDIVVEVRDDSEGSAVQTDPAQVQQVLMNLAVNARDAMRDGGTLRFELRNVETGVDAVPASLPPGPYLRLSVSDTGKGISPEHLERIFDPFFTTKSAGEGTGLGLATTYGIVRQSGGAIHVESREGEGTTFRIHLPRVEAPGVAEAEAAAEPEGGAETVLLVDDDDQIRGLTERLLRSGGYSVLCAGSLDEALELHAAHAAEIGVVLSDVVMPGGHGTHLAARLRERSPGLRLILMSGMGDPEVGAESGAAFLQKPFRRAELLEAVRRVLDA
jgi:PAS domain S-box-containing protein